MKNGTIANKLQTMGQLEKENNEKLETKISKNMNTTDTEKKATEIHFALTEECTRRNQKIIYNESTLNLEF